MINSAIPRTDKHKFIKRWLLILAGSLFVLSLWIIFAPFGAIKIFLLKKEKAQLIELTQAKARDVAQLKNQVDGLKDPQSREIILREELGWVKDNDMVYVFPDKEKK
jgi:cell division protein FtsB